MVALFDESASQVVAASNCFHNAPNCCIACEYAWKVLLRSTIGYLIEQLAAEVTLLVAPWKRPEASWRRLEEA